MPKFKLKRDRIAANPRTGEPMKKERFCPILALLLVIVNGCGAPTPPALDPTVPAVLAALESEGWNIAFVEPFSGRIQTEPRICPSTDWRPAPPEWCLSSGWRNPALVSKPSWPNSWIPHRPTHRTPTQEIPHVGSRLEAIQRSSPHGHPDSMRPILERSV